MLDTAAETRFEPYWWEDARPSAGTQADPPPEADVVVVGSGYTGMTCAIELARAGTDVVVIEAQAIGEGASSRAAGFLSGRTGVSKQIDLVATVGEDRARAILTEADDAYEDLKDRVRTEGIDCDLQECGRYVAATTAKSYAKIARKMAEYAVDAPPGTLRMVPPDEQDAFVRTPLYKGGMEMKDASTLHPAKYHAGLRRLAEEAGAKLVSHTKMEGVVREGDGFRVITSRGDVRARHVALGTNGYTGAATPWHQRRMIPISSTIVATEALSPDLVRHLLPGACPVIDTRRVLEFARPSPDFTRVLFGGRASFLPVSDETKLAILKRRIGVMFPVLADVRLSHVWGGWMGFTFDFLPKLGVQDGVHYALGCNGGSGVVMMSWLGRRMGRAILGADNRASAYEGLTFKTQPFYGGKPWFLPFVGNWYRLRDWMDAKADRFGA
ncbi:MAG: FAD-binding oxidoreductase [Pseudomonadota bacterium]